MLLNHTEEEIPDRKTSEAAKWLSDNNVQFDTPTFWLVAGLLNAYAAECVRVERERCAGIARKHIESSTAQAIARDIKAAQAGGDTQTTEVPPIMVGKGCDREDVHPAWRAWRKGLPKSVLLRPGETENEDTKAYDAIVKAKAEPSGGVGGGDLEAVAAFWNKWHKATYGDSVEHYAEFYGWRTTAWKFALAWAASPPPL